MNTDKIYAESIANEYAPKNTSKIVALKKLDRKAKGKANIFAYTFGTGMTLILGTGLSLSIKNESFLMMVIGIIVGVIGFVGIGINYPIYKKLLENGKSVTIVLVYGLQSVFLSFSEGTTQIFINTVDLFQLFKEKSESIVNYFRR